jgi:signal transduction histidine kinase
MAMENRAATIGARLTVGGRDGAGTVIELDIPLDQNGDRP